MRFMRANNDNRPSGPDVTDLPLILQDLLDRIEAQRSAEDSHSIIGELEVEYRELRGQ